MGTGVSNQLPHPCCLCILFFFFLYMYAALVLNFYLPTFIYIYENVSKPWSGRRSDYGLPPSTSREIASCEEGLATINGLLNKPRDQRLLIHPALMYVAASAGEGRTFQELFDYLGK
jgi:hypothetical protein